MIHLPSVPCSDIIVRESPIKRIPSFYPFKRQPHRLVKHIQIICRQFADELLECVFEHVKGLVLKGLISYQYHSFFIDQY